MNKFFINKKRLYINENYVYINIYLIAIILRLNDKSGGFGFGS